MSLHSADPGFVAAPSYAGSPLEGLTGAAQRAQVTRPGCEPDQDAAWWSGIARPVPPLCPPQHAVRLQAAAEHDCKALGCHDRHHGQLAGLSEPCPEHGCALCHLSRGFGDGCWPCQRLAINVAVIEGPPEDPWCMSHGVPTPDTRKGCATCDVLVRRAKKVDGWSFPGTGHQGVDCVHCDACGLCAGTGRVCRHCWRCPEHPIAEGGADCEQIRWDRVVRAERVYFEHVYMEPGTRQWSA